MNKLYKCALGLLTAFILNFACFSNAGSYNILNASCNSSCSIINNSVSVSSFAMNQSLVLVYVHNDLDTNFNIQCLPQWGGYNYNLSHNFQSNSDDWYVFFPSFGNNETSIGLNCSLKQGQFSGFIAYSYIVKGVFYSTSENFSPICSCSCPTCPTCPSQYTSLECQTEYNLIPVSEVTANYCALNFGMIDPQECPLNEGTGAIVRSNLMINDVPYAQNQNINVFIPDFLAWNISFNDLYTVIDVEGYDADESYIQNVINQEKLTPTNKDIEEMITGFMTNYFPYLALAIIFLYLARKIYKIFK